MANNKNTKVPNVPNLRFPEFTGEWKKERLEDIADFRTRCVHAWNKVVNECMESGVGTAACVVHGGTIMAVLSEIYGGDYYDYHCGNGDGYICDVTEEGHISTIKKITEK